MLRTETRGDSKNAGEKRGTESRNPWNAHRFWDWRSAPPLASANRPNTSLSAVGAGSRPGYGSICWNSAAARTTPKTVPTAQTTRYVHSGHIGRPGATFRTTTNRPIT